MNLVALFLNLVSPLLVKYFKKVHGKAIPESRQDFYHMFPQFQHHNPITFCDVPSFNVQFNNKKTDENSMTCCEGM